MRMELADELEEFVRLGHLWSIEDCSAMVDHLNAESESSGDPLPARLGRFLEHGEYPGAHQREVPGSLRYKSTPFNVPRGCRGNVDRGHPEIWHARR